MLLPFGLESFLFFLALFSRTFGGYLHFTLAVTRVATVPAIEAFGRQSPDPLPAKITISRNFERLRLEVVVLRSNRQVAYHCHDTRRFDFSSHTLAVYPMKSLLLKEYRPDDFHLTSPIFAFPDVLPDPLRCVYFSLVLVGLDPQLPDLHLALTEQVPQEYPCSFVGDNRVVVVPDRTGFKGQVGRLLQLGDIVAQKHLGIKVWFISGYLIQKVQHVIHTLCQVRVFEFRSEGPKRVQFRNSGLVQILQTLGPLAYKHTPFTT